MISKKDSARNEQIPVVCGIIIDGNKLLFVKRRDKLLLEADGQWELPGGKIEFGENSETALLREIKEETGYTVSIKQLLPIIYSTVWEYSEKESVSGFRRQVFLICYICRVDKNIKPSVVDDPKVSAIDWFSAGEIQNLDTIRGTDEIMQTFSKTGYIEFDFKPLRGYQQDIKDNKKALTSEKNYLRRNGNGSLSKLSAKSIKKNAKAVPLSEGKLPPAVLNKMLAGLHHDKSVLIGPAAGEDAAVVKPGSDTLLITTDPITFATKDLADFCFNVNANDIAAMGGVPRYFSVVCMLPPNSFFKNEILGLSSQLSSIAEKAGVSIIGGHTEVSSAVTRPVIVGQMIGTPGKCGVLSSGGAQTGDILFMTKSAALEGTAIIAFEKEERLIAEFGSGFIKDCKELLKNPGISVLRESSIIVECADKIFKKLQKENPSACNPLHAMHDVTEGGIATGAWEMADLSNKGLFFMLENVHIQETTKILCRRFGIDPLGLISSGVLLFAVSKEYAHQFEDALAKEDIRVSEIGEFIDERRCFIKSRNSLSDLPRFDIDEIVKALE